MSNQRPTADLVLLHGKILTMDRNNQEAEAVAIKDGKILAVGKNSQIKKLAGRSTKILNAKGKVILPGFIDCHNHFLTRGASLSYLDLSDAKSILDIKKKVRAKSRMERKGRWVLGRGWDESKWRERRYINRWDLDEAAPHHPVVLIRVDGHMCSVNSKALELAKIPDGIAGLEKRGGEPDGILKEYAAELMLEKIKAPRKKLIQGFKKMTKIAHRLGVTSIHDIVDERGLRTYLDLRKKEDWKIRIYLLLHIKQMERAFKLELLPGFEDEKLKIGGIKVFCDGSLGARTAALYEDYSDEAHNIGMLLHKEKELEEIMEKVHTRGFQLAIHAIGDRAIDAALNSIQEVLRKHPRKDHRHRIEHMEMAREKQLRKGKNLGIIASMQPNFVGEWGLPGGMYEDRLGPKRFKCSNTFRKVIDKRITLVFGSDGMPFSPLYGIHWAVNAPFEDQRISIEDAIRCYTIDAAKASFEEEIKGSISVGKLADIVVLSEDAFKSCEKIKDIPIEATIFNGEVVYQRRTRRKR